MIFVQNWILSGAYAVLAFVSPVSEDPIKLTFMIWGFHIIVWTCVSVKEGLAGMFLIVLVESAKSTDHCFKMNGNAIQ